jgi:hypothetical protein
MTRLKTGVPTSAASSPSGSVDRAESIGAVEMEVTKGVQNLSVFDDTSSPYFDDWRAVGRVQPTEDSM